MIQVSYHERKVQMSGHKRTTVNLNQEDYHRLHEADMLLRSVQKDYQDVKEKIKKLRMDSLWADRKSVV